MSRYFLTLGCVLLGTPFATAQDKAGLPTGAIARFGAPRLQVPGRIVDTAFTPDKRTFVVVHTKQNVTTPNIVLFDVATGMPRNTLPIDQVFQIAMAQQKPLLAMATDDGIEVWNLTAEKRLRLFPYPAKWPDTASLAISPDGTQVIASQSYADPAVIVRCDVTTGKQLPTLPCGLNCAVRFSADGSKIFAIVPPPPASNSSSILRKVIAWNAATGKIQSELKALYDCALASPDGKSIAFGLAGKDITLVDLETRKTLTVLNAPHERFVFTPDGKQLVTIAEPQPSRLWDIATGKEMRQFRSIPWSSNLLPQITCDGTLLAAQDVDSRNCVRFWDVATGSPRFPNGHPGAVNGLAFSSDGRWLATYSGDTLLVHDVKTGVEKHRFFAHRSSITQIAFSPDNQSLAAASTDGNIILWDPATGKERKRFAAKDSVVSLAFSRDGTALTSINKDRSIETWDIAKGIVVRSMNAPATRRVALSPSAQFCAGFGGGFRYGSEEFEAAFHWSNLQGNRMPPSIPIQSYADSEQFRIHHAHHVSELVFSADSKRFASLSGAGLFLWETASRREILRLSTDSQFSLIAISPDSRILAHGANENNQSLVLRDIAAGQNDSQADTAKEALRVIDGHRGSITCAAFSPDGQFLATGGSDQNVYLWPVKDFFKPSKFVEEKADIASYWPHLADVDAGKAYRAIAQLEHRPNETLALLRRHLKPIPVVDEKAVAKHLHDLGNTQFAVRQQAYSALEKLGDQAPHLLQAAYKSPPNLEVKRRLEALLDRLDNPTENVHQLRIYRCLTLLERINSAESRQLLEELSCGAPTAWLTVEAKYVLQRTAQLAANGK